MMQNNENNNYNSPLWECRDTLLYEFNKIPLSGYESKYISIPLSVIMDDTLDVKAIGILAYLRVHCGLNDIVGFTIDDMVEWCGYKPNRNVVGKMNDKFLDILDTLSDRGYLTILTKRSRSMHMKCKFNTEYYSNECLDGFSYLYLDELDKILKYKSSNGKSISGSTLLLVFAYLRNKIFRRPNKLKPEERSKERIEERRARCPEAYNDMIINIANDLRMTRQTLAKAIDVLEDELQLIVTDKAYRVKVENNKYKTPPTIFANAYKREDKYLLAAGEEYSRTETELKANIVKQYYKNYKINKDIRG